jgi:uncharacterized protein (TIRG00374 family)
MLYQELSSTRFIPSENGTYEWIDANQNGLVEAQVEEEFVLSPTGNYKKATISDSLSTISWTWKSIIWLLAAIIFMILRDLGYIIRIRVLTEGVLSWKKSTWVILMWEFASALSPGIVGGSAVAMFILKREKIPLGKSTAIVMITAFLDNLFYVIMVPFVFIFIQQSDLFPSSANNVFLSNTKELFWIGFGVVFGFCLILFLSIFYFPKLIKSILVFIFSLPIIRKWKQQAIHTGDDVILTSKEYKNKPFAFWLKAFGGTFMSWSSRFLVVNCVLMMFTQLGFIDNILVFARQFVMWLILLITPTPGGSGMAEYAFKGFFSDFTSSGLVISAMAILWRLVSYFPYLFIGSGLLSKVRKRKL